MSPYILVLCLCVYMKVEIKFMVLLNLKNI